MSKVKVKAYGIHGKARSGKDLFANLLGDALGSDDEHVAVMSFADVLKDMLVPLLRVLTPGQMPDNHFIHECLTGELKEAPLPSIGRSPRQLMQWLGTEWGRELVDQDIWTKVMGHRIDWRVQSLMDYAPDAQTLYVLIPDVRFDNEAQWLSGRVIHIVRPNTETVQEHASEGGVSDYHVATKVFNDGTIDDLYKQAERVAMEIRNGRI